MPGLAPLIAHRGCAMEWAPRVLDTHHMQQGDSPPFRVTPHPFRVTHTNSKHTEQARPTYGICFVIHDAGRWTLGVTLVCEVFLFQGAREL